MWLVVLYLLPVLRRRSNRRDHHKIQSNKKKLHRYIDNLRALLVGCLCLVMCMYGLMSEHRLPHNSVIRSVSTKAMTHCLCNTNPDYLSSDWPCSTTPSRLR